MTRSSTAKGGVPVDLSLLVAWLVTDCTESFQLPVILFMSFLTRSLWDTLHSPEVQLMAVVAVVLHVSG